MASTATGRATKGRSTAAGRGWPLFGAIAFLACGHPQAPPPAPVPLPLASRPPMGWNSWDAYGRSIQEADVRASAAYMAQHLAPHGWQYVVIDEGWYVTRLGPNGNDEGADFALDAYGRYLPDVARFPSAAGGAGFKPLADYVHGLGLKLGIHVLRGIPRRSVEQNLPIAGSPLRARAAANTTDLCPWNTYNYGLDPASPAAQSYDDSIARLYGDWGVDFIKADCIASHPYVGAEIRMLHQAIAASGRPMVLSLSPGPTPVDKREEVAAFSQMWRISDDVWDVWSSTTQFPQGVRNQIENAARWIGASGPGHWPDADMLPIGSLRPAAGWGDARETRLTRDEQRAMLTFWCIVRSPLMMGGNLLSLDEWTLSLLTNDEVLAVDQQSTEARRALETADLSVWTARAESGAKSYVAVMNLADAAQTVHRPWADLGLAGPLFVRDLWERRDRGLSPALDVTMPPHGAALLAVMSVETAR